MGIRLTGISTPFGGLEWEYSDSIAARVRDELHPTRKLQVFISSKCGEPKYDTVRKALKEKIEATQLADVYCFEGSGASTLPAIDNYTWSLEDSDVCIFLIDNADGVPEGVQNEIDTVRKKKIRALYYFCDKESKEKTAVELSLLGAHSPKMQTIHELSELVEDGAQALVDDIVKIYHYYCAGKLLSISEDRVSSSEFDVVGAEKTPEPAIPKTVIKEIEKCKNYLVRLFVDSKYRLQGNEENHSSEIDEWGFQFLPILFEGRSIKQFNTAMLLDTLKSKQDGGFYSVVEIRWCAIQAFFMGDVDACIRKLEEALETAKKTDLPGWVIKDILIDLRNMEIERSNIINTYSEPGAQSELSNSEEEVYYPTLDRVNESLQEKYIDNLYKEKIKSPYSVTFGSSVIECCEMLASSYIIAVYNGSLTHIRRMYENVRRFLFFMSSKYDDWTLRRDLLMIAVFSGEESDVNGILNSFPEILDGMKSEDASRIMSFCSNHPIKYKRMISQLLAFRAIGYYLNDEEYKKAEAVILNDIIEWLSDENSSMAIGSHIFPSLSGVSHRISQDKMAEICWLFIERHYSRWYIDMFKYMAKSINICKMQEEKKNTLISHIIGLFDDSDSRDILKVSTQFLIRFRQQDRSATEELDSKIKEYFPEFYEGVYKLETTNENERDMPVFIERYIKQVKKHNATQDANGYYAGYSSNNLATIRSILVYERYAYDSILLDEVIKAAEETLLYAKEFITTKMDAISILMCISQIYTSDYLRNQDVYAELYSKRNDIKAVDVSILSNNIDDVALKIALCLSFSVTGHDMTCELMEHMSLLQNDKATTIAVTRFIAEYLELTDTVLLPEKIEDLIMTNVLVWLHSEYIDIRWNAMRILLSMSRSEKYATLVNHQLLQAIDTQSAYIKNLIMRRIYKLKGVTKQTREYVMKKCEKDASFVVRMVCNEIKEGNDNE